MMIPETSTTSFKIYLWLVSHVISKMVFTSFVSISCAESQAGKQNALTLFNKMNDFMSFRFLPRDWIS